MLGSVTQCQNSMIIAIRLVNSNEPIKMRQRGDGQTLACRGTGEQRAEFSSFTKLFANHMQYIVRKKWIHGDENRLLPNPCRLYSLKYFLVDVSKLCCQREAAQVTLSAIAARVGERDARQQFPSSGVQVAYDAYQSGIEYSYVLATQV